MKLKLGLPLPEELPDVLVLGPIRQLSRVDDFDEIVVDERLLHATDDVDHVIAGRATAGHQGV